MKYDDTHITEIAGYHLAERIGSGGMGDVYKAYNSALQRTAAVKVLHQKDMAERFRNEAYIQSSVSHPNIACLYEYLVTGDTACIIMEFVEGETLDRYLHRKGKLSNEEAENIVQQVASALAYLHDKHIIHRDVKPQNFKIQPGGTVTMLDFGIAKNKYTPRLTQMGFVVGTTEYMAPEQFQQRVELKSDVWSLGVMAYELVTGYLPFEATNPVTLRSKIEKGTYTDPRIMAPALSESLRSLIERSLRVNPSSRISATEIEKLFGKHEQVTPIKRALAGPVTFPPAKKKAVIIGATALLLIIVSMMLFNRTSSEDVVKKEADVATETVAADLHKLTIAVPNASNAYIVFPDGSSQKLPYEIQGKEGQNFEFTLQAEGFVSRKIEVPITNRRKSYEYFLEKVNE